MKKLHIGLNVVSGTLKDQGDCQKKPVGNIFTQEPCLLLGEQINVDKQVSTFEYNSYTDTYPSCTSGITAQDCSMLDDGKGCGSSQDDPCDGKDTACYIETIITIGKQIESTEHDGQLEGTAHEQQIKKLQYQQGIALKKALQRYINADSLETALSVLNQVAPFATVDVTDKMGLLLAINNGAYTPQIDDLLAELPESNEKTLWAMQQTMRKDGTLLYALTEKQIETLHTMIAQRSRGYIVAESWLEAATGEKFPLIIDETSTTSGRIAAPKRVGEILRCSPNPAQDEVSIHYLLPNNTTTGNIVIYNLLGSKMKTVAVSSDDTNVIYLDISTLPVGTYIYTLEVNGRVIARQKMAITK